MTAAAKNADWSTVIWEAALKIPAMLTWWFCIPARFCAVFPAVIKQKVSE